MIKSTGNYDKLQRSGFNLNKQVTLKGIEDEDGKLNAKDYRYCSLKSLNSVKYYDFDCSQVMK